MNAVYAPAVATARQDDLDKVYSGEAFLTSIGLNTDGTAPDGMTFISRSNPVGTKVVKFSDETASVSVWYSALFGLAGEGSKNPVSESWFTNTFELAWIDGDWKVTDFTQKDGPVPVGRDQAASLPRRWPTPWNSSEGSRIPGKRISPRPLAGSYGVKPAGRCRAAGKQRVCRPRPARRRAKATTLAT